MRDMNHTLTGIRWVRRNPDPAAEGGSAPEDYRAIAHVFIEDQYMDSYPMKTASEKEARKTFQRQGYFVDKPFVHVFVDDLAAFMHGGGTMSPEQFQDWTGLDIVTWIWDKGPYPDFILYQLGQRPGIGLPVEYDEAWAEKQRWSQSRARNLYDAIEKSIYRNRERIQGIAWSVSYDVAQRIRKPGEERNLFMWVIEMLKESDLDIYK